MKKLLILLCFFITFEINCQKTIITQDNDNFYGAVLQHNTVWNNSENYGRDTQLANLEIYEQYIVKAKANEPNLNIMVFPEYGLGRDEKFRSENAKYGENIPNINPHNLINPCLSNTTFQKDRPALFKMSCMAKEHKIYLVIGCIDVQFCEKNEKNCPDDGMFIYNTAVAFDSEGNLIQKYWKYHIFFTLTGVFNIPEQPQVRYFDTNFGVRFGMFICFDITFPEPVNSLLNLGIRHFTFPTSWTQLPPLVTATQFQQSFSRVHSSTLLAANDAYSSATSGSGLYFNGTAVQTFFNPNLEGNADEKLLIGKLPKKMNGNSISQISLKENEEKKHILKTEGGKKNSIFKSDRLCGLVPGGCIFFRPKAGDKNKISAKDGNITCTLEYEISKNSPNTRETFALFAISHWVWFSQWIDTQTCGVVKCIDDVICIILDPFLKEYHSEVIFENLSIKAENFSEDIKVYPLLSTNNGQIAQPKDLKFSGSQMSFQGTVSEPLLSANLLGLLRKKSQ